MPLAKTWFTEANRTMDDVTTGLKSNASVLFALQALLKGGVQGTAGTSGHFPSSGFWTVDSSSNSTLAGSGDKFSAGFVAAEWVRANAGSAHTWYVLKSPVSSGITDGPWYLMISWGTTVDANLVIGFGKVQPTGGTTTADPTASGQSIFVSTAFLFTQASNGKCHLVADAKGNFHFLQSFNGSGRFSTYFSVQELTETRSSGDAARVACIADSLNSGNGVPRLGCATLNSGQGWRGNANDGTTALTSTTGKLGGLSWNNSSDETVRLVVSAIDSKTDAVPCAYCYDTTAAHQALRGRLGDVWALGAQVAPGSGTPAAATPDRIAAGTALIPFGVTPGL